VNLQGKLLAISISVAVSTTTAFADSTTEAKQHFELASAAHKAGKFRDALNELMLAYALDPKPELLYAIAQVHVKLGECPQAITFYERFLASNPKPEFAARANAAINICKTNPPPAEAQVADPAKPREELGPTREEHLRKAAEADALAATERRKAEEARLAAERERENEKLYNRHPARLWALVGVGVGAGAAITGGVFGLSARSAQSAFDDAGCGQRDAVLTPDQVATCRSDAERGERNALLGNILVGAGGAVLVTSVIILVLDPGNLERPEAPRVGITPHSITFTARW
jgi:tetratricopeptide (TPR) repeat protein